MNHHSKSLLFALCCMAVSCNAAPVPDAVPVVQREEPTPMTVDQQQQCVTKFLQDLIQALQYVSQDAKNEQEQKALLESLMARLAVLETHQKTNVKNTELAALSSAVNTIKNNQGETGFSFNTVAAAAVVGAVAGMITSYTYMHWL